MKTEKVEKFAANLHSKREYVIHIRNLKQAINYEAVLKKVNRVIKFNHEAWLKPYIDRNIELRKNARTNLKKNFKK